MIQRLFALFLAVLLVSACFMSIPMQAKAAGDEIDFDDLLDKIPSEEEIQDGWNTIDGYVFYMVNGEPVRDWKSIEGSWYYFDKSGIMQTGLVVIGSTTYGLAENGKMLTGWQRVDGTWYFFDKTSGAAKTGWYQEGATWYYMTAEGKMVTGEYTIGTALHKFNSSGVWLGEIKQPQKNGWVLESGKWYYYKNNVMQKGWLQEGSTWYYLDSNGQMVTGEYTIGSAVHKFNGSGVWLGEVKEEQPETQKNGWVQESGKWYYYVNGAKKTGWLQDGKTWYYLKSDGVMATGWVQVGSVWYYMQSSGAMKTGWLQQGSTWYYLQSSGAMATGSLKIGTKTYNFNASGACLNP